MKKGTQTTLVTDLIYEKQQETAGHKVEAIKKMIERAEKGDYHCLKSGLPIPKVLLHRDCQLIGLDNIAKKVFNSEYDEL